MSPISENNSEGVSPISPVEAGQGRSAKRPRKMSKEEFELWQMKHQAHMF